MLITLELIKTCSVHIKPRKQESIEEYLKRLTHLHLNGKHISKISSLDTCVNLEVLYLYDNEIKTIENLDTLTKLTHLYLQDNLISKLSNLDNFSLLQKLSLDRNCISVVEGLHNLENLEELSISSQQRASPDMQITFDQPTILSLSRTLSTLHCASNNITSLGDIALFGALTHLDLSNNHIDDFHELQTLLKSCVRLKKLQLKGNPVCKKREYKDEVVSFSSPALQILDDKEITSNERMFLEKKASMRKSVPPHSQSSSTAPFPASIPSFPPSNSPTSRRNSSGSIKKGEPSLRKGPPFGGT